eukprot:3059597-Prymnesium_polylepis.3
MTSCCESAAPAEIERESRVRGPVVVCADTRPRPTRRTEPLPFRGRPVPGCTCRAGLRPACGYAASDS